MQAATDPIPNDWQPEDIFREAQHCLDARRIGRAKSLAQSGLDRWPNAIGMYLLRARTLEADRDVDEATRILRAAVDRFPKDLRAPAALTWALLRTGDLVGATTLSGIAKERGLGETAAGRMELAIALAREDWPVVRRAAETLVRLETVPSAQLLLSLARACRRLRDVEGAKKAATRALEADAQLTGAISILAWAADEEGDSDEALALYHRLAELDPGNPDWLYEIARILETKGRESETIAVLRDATDRFSADPQPAVNLARACLKDGQMREAEAALATARERGLDEMVARRVELAIAVACEDWPVIRRSSEALIAMETVPTAQLLLSLARACRRLRDVEGAKKAATRALEADAQLTGAISILAWAADEEGDSDEALALYHRLAELDPGNPDWLYEIARILETKGRESETIAVLRDATDRFSADPQPAVNLARACLKDGQMREAEAALATARERGLDEMVARRVELAIAVACEDWPVIRRSSEALIAMETVPTAQLLLTLARACRRLKDIDRAEEAATRALEADAQLPAARSILAWAASERVGGDKSRSTDAAGSRSPGQRRSSRRPAEVHEQVQSQPPRPVIPKDEKYRHELLNDKWAIEHVYNGLRKGFFIEAGATNGVNGSATLVLEQEYGWDGICVEPIEQQYHRLTELRACKADNRALFSESGATLDFTFLPERSGLSGLSQFLRDKTKHLAEEPAGSVQVQKLTVSLLDLLKEHKAPETIHYLCLDVEGGEREILRTFPFDSPYRILAVSIEGDRCNDLMHRNNYVQVRNPYSKVISERYFLHRDLARGHYAP